MCDHLSQWGKTVGGAAGVRDNVHVILVGLVVDAHDKHWGVSRRSRNDDLLGSTLRSKPMLMRTPNLNAKFVMSPQQHLDISLKIIHNTTARIKRNTLKWADALSTVVKTPVDSTT